MTRFSGDVKSCAYEGLNQDVVKLFDVFDGSRFSVL
jgi:hypothetical protein